MVVVASFSKVCFFSENDRSARQHHFEIFPLSRPFSEVIFFSENDHSFWSFSCRCKVKTQRQVCGFDENDMKTYSCTMYGVS